MHTGETRSAGPGVNTGRLSLNKQAHGGLLSRFLGRPFKWSKHMTPLGAAPHHQQQSHRQLAIASGMAMHVMQQATTSEPSQEQCSMSFDLDLGYSKDMESQYVTEGKELGKGGNGSVVLVTHMSTGLQYACKSIPKVLGEGVSERKRETHIESLRREIGVLQKLKGCLNIVELHDVFEDKDHVHIIMECCKGGELWHRVGDRHYSERTVASYMRGVLRTVAVMHSHHILHRDIKPGNFMLLNDSDSSPLKAIDFGLAMPFEPDQLPLTHLGLEGTPWYMAPETLCHDVTPASDVWAAGVMAHEMLTGHLPFDDKRNPNNAALSAIWRSVLNDRLEFGNSMWDDISDEAKDFVAMLLQREPAKRPTARQALEHPWLKGNVKDRSSGKRLARSVVQRIQRFAQNDVVKRAVLQDIAETMLAAPASDEEHNTCSISARGRPVLATPNAAALDGLYRQLSLDQEQSVSRDRLAKELKAMGFRLEASEVQRLLEQVDAGGTGQVGKAAFAASQIDWRELQQNHKQLWLEAAQTTFNAMDADKDGVLQANDLAEGLHGRVPEFDVDKAVQEALQGAGMHRGAEALDFQGFVDMLKVGSLESLDMYDDCYENGSTHHSRGSVDRLNDLMHRTASAGSLSSNASRHGPGGLYAGLGGAGSRDPSLHSGRVPGPEALTFRFGFEQPAPSPQPVAAAAASFFRFDFEQKPAVAAAAATLSSRGPSPAADFFRFDFEVPAPPPPPREAPAQAGAAGFFRFDVGDRHAHAAAAQQQPVAQHTDVADMEGEGVAQPPLQFPQDSGSGLGGRVRGGGQYDRRHRGSSLYKNAMLAAGGAKLAPVQE